MSRTAILALLGLLAIPAARSAPRPAARPSKPWPAGAPRQAALMIGKTDDEEDNRLALVDLRTSTVEVLGKIDADALVWSPDGSLLAYRVGGTVNLRRMADGGTITVPASIAENPQSARYGFSPDGRRLVTASGRRLELFSSPDFQSKEVVAVPDELELVDAPSWLPGRTLFAALGAPPGRGAEQRLVVVDLEARPPSAKVLPLAVTDCSLLGARKDQWLVLGIDEARVDAVGADGHSQTLVPADPSTDDVAESYVEALDALVLGRRGLGERDPTQQFLLPLSGDGHRRPWLRRFAGLDEYTFTRDERWVLFTVTARVPRGANDYNSLYLAGADGARPIRVLAPRSRSSWYHDVAIRPSAAP
jgi:hypothetical protein